MTLYKTIADKNGGHTVVMTAEEEAAFLAEQQAYVEPAPAPPSDTEIRLAALEAKVGITAQDKEAALSSLMSVSVEAVK